MLRINLSSYSLVKKIWMNKQIVEIIDRSRIKKRSKEMFNEEYVEQEARNEGKWKKLHRDETLMQTSDQRYINNDYQGTKRESRHVRHRQNAWISRVLPSPLLCWFIAADKTRPRILRRENLSETRGKKKRRLECCLSTSLSQPGNTADLYCFKQSVHDAVGNTAAILEKHGNLISLRVYPQLL